MTRTGRLLLSLLTLVALCGTALLWMAGGIQTPKTTTEQVQPHPDPVDVRTLTVMTWNIAWGYGAGSEGQGYHPIDRDALVSHLREIARWIRTVQPDVVLLQEVDFAARRSHHIDQAVWLSEQTGLPYVAKAESWHANWVPFPYWPPSHHFGDVRSGGAVLSRLPILRNIVELQPHPDAYPWWYRLFYLFRYTQTVELATRPAPLHVVNLHFEAWDRDARLAHARRLAGQIRAQSANVLLFGGDLNTVPPEAAQKSGFPGYPEDDYRDDPTMNILRAVPGFREVAAAIGADPDAPDWRTFPATAPDRRLDYVFVRDGWRVDSAHVLTGPTASDHLPVVAHLVRADASGVRDPLDGR